MVSEEDRPDAAAMQQHDEQQQHMSDPEQAEVRTPPAPVVVEADVILEGMPVRARFDGKAGELSWQPSNPHASRGSGSLFGSALGKTGRVSFADELLGFHYGASTIMIRTFPTVPSSGCLPGNQGTRKRRDINIDFRDQEEHAAWADALEAWLENSGRPRRLLVVVNPSAGKGKARETYLRQVLPLLEAANVTVTMLETHYHKHAIEIAKGLNLNLYDGIACVSGDGILTEILNGFLERADWQRAIQTPLGHIVSGSGNGMGKTAMAQSQQDEICNVHNTTFVVIAGKTSPLDVVTISQGASKFHGILNFAWGMTSDVDVESERFRFLGGFRLTLQSIVRIISMRKYKGSLQYIPATEDQVRAGANPLGISFDAALQAVTGADGEFQVPSIDSLAGADEWKSVDGEFVLVWGQNVPWAATDMFAAPRAQLCDGLVDVMVVKQCSRLQLLSLFLAMEEGKHIDSPLVQHLKVKAMKLTPGGRTKGKVPGGILAMDGEVVARGVGAVGNRSEDIMEYENPFHFTVSQGLAQLYVA